MKKLLLFLLLIPFAYGLSINIDNPPAYGDMSSVFNLNWGVNDNYKYCYYNYDNGNQQKTTINQNKIKLLNTFGSNSTSEMMYGASQLAITENGGDYFLYVATQDALVSWKINDPVFPEFGNNAYVGYNNGCCDDGCHPVDIQCPFYGQCVTIWELIDDLIGWDTTIWDGVSIDGWRSPGANPSRLVSRDGESKYVVTLPGIDTIKYIDASVPTPPLYPVIASLNGDDNPNYLDNVNVIYYTPLDTLIYADSSSTNNAISIADLTASTMTHTTSLVLNPDINGVYDATMIGNNHVYLLNPTKKSILVFNITSDSIQWRSTIGFIEDMPNTVTRIVSNGNYLYVLDSGKSQVYTFLVSGTNLDNIDFISNNSLTNKNLIALAFNDLDYYDYLLYAPNKNYGEISVLSTLDTRNISVNFSIGIHNITIVCKEYNNSFINKTVHFTVSGNDYDADGINDSVDNCPLDSNSGQEDNDKQIIRNDNSTQNYDCLYINYYNSTHSLCSDGGNVCDSCLNNFNLRCLNCPSDNPVFEQPNSDSDYRGDACDNCRFVSNYGQEDYDLDTVGDVCDNCPYINNTNQSVNPCLTCPEGWANISISGSYYCIDANCTNGRLDTIIGETLSDYGGYCGTCINYLWENNSGFKWQYLTLPEAFVDMGGRCGYCNDSLINGEETIADYGGHCGTCIDKILSPFLNETETDYGGLCGSCGIGTKDSDVIWSAIPKKIYPFDEMICDQGEATVSLAIIILLILLGGVAIVFGVWGLLMLLGFLNIFMGIKRIFGKKKKNNTKK